MSIVFVTLQQLTSYGFLARQWKMAASMMVTYGCGSLADGQPRLNRSRLHP